MGTVRRCMFSYRLVRSTQSAKSSVGGAVSKNLGLKDDHDINAAEWIVYDALDASRQEMVRQAKPDGMFRS
jgi:hypothetical protein